MSRERLPDEQGVLLISNHVSWLDITVLSAVAPVSFVAKQEVASWPFVSWLAKLQRSVFVDRNRRNEVGDKANEILSRLAGRRSYRAVRRRNLKRRQQRGAVQDGIVRGGQAGGRRADGSRSGADLALTYHQDLRAAALPPRAAGVAWYGDMDMASHAWRLLGSGRSTFISASDRRFRSMLRRPQGARPLCRGQGAQGRGRIVARTAGGVSVGNGHRRCPRQHRDYIARRSRIVSSTVAGAKLPFGSCRMRPAFTTVSSVVWTPRSAVSASAK